MQAVKIHDILCLVIPKGRPILYLEIEVKIKQERKGFRSMIARSFIKSIESNQFNQIPFYQKFFIRLILSNQFDQMNFIK